MSDSKEETQNSAIFNDLAPEIWNQIFREVTAVPDSLENPQLLVDLQLEGGLVLSKYAHKRHTESLVCHSQLHLYE